ncbi:MAG: sensor histidine kinase, partial [Ktedonobacterales bacterium]
LEAKQADAGHVALTVTDTGMGIPLEDQDRIFGRFYRTDASRARASGGFGLGLAIVRDLVQALGGTVTVQSGEGEGSRFQVRLLVASGA